MNLIMIKFGYIIDIIEIKQQITHMKCPHTAVTMPHIRTHLFDPPSALMQLSQQGPIHRLRYPDGHLGWLVTSHTLIQDILTDPRFSARSEFKRAPIQREGIEPFYGRSALPGWLVDMDPPQHTRIRRALSDLLSMRRLQNLKPRLVEIVNAQLEHMKRQGAPLDLVEHFSLPIPSLAICEILGVPYEARREFQHHSEMIFSLTATATEATESMNYLTTFMLQLVREKRQHPTNDVLGELGRLTSFDDAEIAGAAVLLLSAGHETTANMLSLGTLALLTNPTQLSTLLCNPNQIHNAVSELLRYITIFQFGVPRTPLEDLELAGHHIRAGESMTLSLPIANRDPAKFTDPNSLDITRCSPSHLAFGFGIHFCLGRNLALLELEMGYLALLQTFPTLHLAVPTDRVHLNTSAGFYGIHCMPVAW